MGAKRISAVALINLQEALTLLYWYRKDLRRFLVHVLGETTLLQKYDWEHDYKRHIACDLVDRMAARQDLYQEQLLKLMVDVANVDDFSHLARLEDGERKSKEAKAAVLALRKEIGGLKDFLADIEAVEKRRESAAQQVQQVRGLQEKLAELHQMLMQLTIECNHQKRGYELEKLIRELFALFELDPRASFRLTGEQIDGAFTFDSTDYLFEAKWQKELVGIEELDAFKGKVERKHGNTLGIFLSMNGFSEPAVTQFSATVRRLVFLIDAMDLMAVLDGRIELPEVLRRKRREAGQSGNIYLRINEML